MEPVSIIIATLNEAQNIEPLIKQLFSVMKKNSISSEVIIVVGGSVVGSSENVLKPAEHYPVRLYSRVDKHGLASAVSEGARSARYETVVVMDADLSHPPEDVPRLIRAVRSNTCDIAIGSRYTPGGRTPDWPLKRRVASRLASFPAQLLTGVDDPLSGFFAVSRNRLLLIRDDVPGYKICLELLLGQGEDMKVMEIPISLRDRHSGVSKMSVETMTAYAIQLCSLCGISELPGFSRLLAILMCFGLTIDGLVYSGCSALGLSLFAAHTAGLMGSIAAVFVIDRFLSPDKYQNRLLQRPALFLLLFLAVIVRIRMYTCIHNALGENALPWLPALSTAALSALAVSLFFLIAAPAIRRKPVNRAVRFRLLLIGVISLSLFLRLLFAGSFELLQEEAYYWNYAQHPDIGYLDHPPMVAVLIKIGLLLFGNSEFGVRIGAVFCWCIATLFVFLYTRDLSTRDNALRSAAIMSVVPVFFIFGFVMTPDAPLIACWAGALFFARRAIVAGNQKSWIGLGLLLGLGLFSKYTIALLAPSLFIVLLADPAARHWLFKPKPYFAAALALIVFSPVIIWNMEHDWASFLFQTQNRITSSSEFSTHELIASIAALLSPVGLFVALFFLSCRKAFSGWTEISKRHYTFAFTLIMVPLSVFFIFSLSKEVKFNWTGPIWLAALPYMAATLSPDYGNISEWKGARLGKAWKGTVFFLLIAYAGLLHYFSSGLPGVPYFSDGPLLGWDDYSVQVETLVHSIEQETGERPAVVGMDQYRTASGLAFYRTLQFEKEHKVGMQHPTTETIGRNILGRDAVMYGYWNPSKQLTDATLLLVSPKPADLHPKWLAGKKLQIGGIHALEAAKNNHRVAPLFYRFIKTGEPDSGLDRKLAMDNKTIN